MSIKDKVPLGLYNILVFVSIFLRKYKIRLDICEWEKPVITSKNNHTVVYATREFRYFNFFMLLGLLLSFAIFIGICMKSERNVISIEVNVFCVFMCLFMTVFVVVLVFLKFVYQKKVGCLVTTLHSAVVLILFLSHVAAVFTSFDIRHIKYNFPEFEQKYSQLYKCITGLGISKVDEITLFEYQIDGISINYNLAWSKKSSVTLNNTNIFQFECDNFNYKNYKGIPSDIYEIIAKFVGSTICIVCCVKSSSRASFSDIFVFCTMFPIPKKSIPSTLSRKIPEILTIKNIPNIMNQDTSNIKFSVDQFFESNKYFR